MRRRRAVTGILACLAALACAPAAASARSATVTSFDGTLIGVHLFAPTTPPPGGRAPTVLVGATYPSPGETRADQDVGDRIGLAALRRAGYNVVTWDPRGIGGSGGTVMFDSPAFEGRDARAILDWLATQPEAQLDAPGDPRVGMSGTSYGATIQYVLAAIDARVDAIVPDIGWHSLVTSLVRGRAVKTGWLAPLCGLDTVAGAVDGRARPTDVRPATASPELKTACIEGVAGDLTRASRTWLADRGPGALVRQIRAPTLITQGTWDTFFPLDEAIANYEALRASGTPVKMIWYCGGHVPCPTEASDPGRLSRAGLAWFDRWLRGNPQVDTGPAFEWLADDGVWRAGPDFPLAPTGTLDAVGSGPLTVAPRYSPARGLGRVAGPARNAVEALFPPPPGEADVVGTPRVRLVYRGRARPARTHLYAQIVDGEADEVLGGQATPLPVILDGRERTVQRPLEAVAAHGRPSSSYRLQITAGAPMYELQRSRGRVTVYGAVGALPLVDASRSGRGFAPRTPRRPRIGLSARRAEDRLRIRVRARFRTRPCTGSVTFVVRTARRPFVRNAALKTRPCRAARTLRLRVPAGSVVRVSATFNGNAELKPRRAREVTRRVADGGLRRP